MKNLQRLSRLTGRNTGEGQFFATAVIDSAVFYINIKKSE